MTNRRSTLHERAERSFCSSDPTLVEELSDALKAADEALAACQSQAAGRIRELESQLKAARYSDELVDSDEDERDDSPYCDCGDIPTEEEEAFNRCSCCGKRIDE